MSLTKNPTEFARSAARRNGGCTIPCPGSLIPLRRPGSRLLLRRGAAAPIIRGLAVETSASAVLWNRRYGGPERAIDAEVKTWAADCGISAASFQANLMFEPWTVRTGAGGPYKVFTPFWRACLNGPEPRRPLAAPGQLPAAAPVRERRTARRAMRWSTGGSSPAGRTGVRDWPAPGLRGKRAPILCSHDFLDGPAADYSTGRNIPGVEGTSRLSPHLRFGEISPFRIWHALRDRFPDREPADVGIFRSELGWREFCWQLLYENPSLASRNYRPDFDHFAWEAPSADGAARLAARTNRLPAGRRRHAPALADRLDAQPGADGRGILPGQEPADRLAAGRSSGSGTPWLTPTRPAIRPTGSGWPGPALMPRRISGSSTPSRRARSSTPTADTCGSSFLSLRASTPKRSTSRGRRPRPASRPGVPGTIVGLPESRARALDAYQRLKDG